MLVGFGLGWWLDGGGLGMVSDGGGVVEVFVEMLLLLVCWGIEDGRLLEDAVCLIVCFLVRNEFDIAFTKRMA